MLLLITPSLLVCSFGFYVSTIAYTSVCMVSTGRTYGYYHDVYTMKTSPSRYHARLGNMRTTTTRLDWIESK